MQRQGYSYHYSPAAAPKYSSNHATSSAFSASANPNEDWTKISDLAERRRIQNRIAQRNYRKKLKRRLEDLERRAASSSASPPQRHQELSQTKSEGSTSPEQRNSSKSRKTSPASVHGHISPEILPSNNFLPTPAEEHDAVFPSQYVRDASGSPPPFAYNHSYPAHDQVLYHPYSQHQPSYHQMPVISSEEMFSLSSVPATLPNMMAYTTSIENDSVYAKDDSMNPFGMNYAIMAGVDIPSSHMYQQEQNPHTPPFSQSFDPSPLSSPCESLLAYPPTPGSG